MSTSVRARKMNFRDFLAFLIVSPFAAGIIYTGYMMWEF